MTVSFIFENVSEVCVLYRLKIVNIFSFKTCLNSAFWPYWKIVSYLWTLVGPHKK